MLSSQYPHQVNAKFASLYSPWFHQFCSDNGIERWSYAVADPASADAWVGWAGVLFEQGHYEEAADLVKKVLS